MPHALFRIGIVLLAIFCGLHLLASGVHAATYYVSTGEHGESSVSDGNSCGTATNINTPKRNITGGSGGLSCLSGAGDTLYIRGGSYNEWIQGGTYPGGSSYDNVSPGGSVVWIGAYTPDGANYESVLIWVDGGGGVTLEMASQFQDGEGTHYVVWDHLHVHQRRPVYQTIGATNSTQIFQNGEVTHENYDTNNPSGWPTNESGCGLNPPEGLLANGILVVVQERGTAGRAPGVIFRNNYFHDEKCTFAFYVQAHADWVGGLIIENNRFERFGFYAIQFYMANDLEHQNWWFRNMYVRNNILTDCGNGKKDDGGTQNSGCVTIYKCKAPCEFYNNVNYIARSGWDVKGHSDGVKIYNNTFYQTAGDPGSIGLFQVQDDTTNTEIRNNLSYLGGNTFLTDGLGHTGTLFNVTQSNNSFGVDPHFANPGGSPPDFHLTAATPSSIVNAGMTLSSVPTDKDGNARPAGGAYDLGAYEYGGVVTPPPLPAPTNLHLSWQP